MFRAQQNAFDEAVAKATDENLTSENWEYILDVCDRVSTEDTGAKDAVAAMIKRLAHRNANVQLYTLELANSLSQNCGVKVHVELASRSFTDALLRLTAERTTHQQVKAKILERMAEWTEMFRSNPDLGIMEQAYTKLKSQNPNLQPPSKPTKRQITDVDRQKEEEELQMALALSIKDKGTSGVAAPKPNASELPGNASSSQAAALAPIVPQGTTAATVSRVRALYDFQPSEPGELQFRKGDIIAVLESVYKDWWKGSLRGQTGIFPLNYVEKLSDPTQEELQREAQMEAEVFAQIKNVEKLLTLLSTGNGDLGRSGRDSEEITSLYQSTVAIRPKLIELIGKYSQKKDDFTQLNEKFIKARRDYEALLESSMAHPAQPYGRQVQSMYGYPPAGAPQAYPPQDPGRYYTPGPQGRPQDSSLPPNGGMPFYPTTQTPLPYPTSVGSPGPRHRTPSGSHPYAGQQQDTYSLPYGQPRPHTTYEHPPQELGTSVYDSPVDPPSGQQAPYPQPQQAAPSAPSGAAPGAGRAPYPPSIHQAQATEYSPSVYTPDGHAPPTDPNSAASTHIQHQQPHPYSQPPITHQPSAPPPSEPQPQQQQQGTAPSYPTAPTHAPPSVPAPVTTPTPPTPHNQGSAYPAFNHGQAPPQPQAPGQGQAYQAYAPQAAAGAAGAASDPSRFYR